MRYFLLREVPFGNDGDFTHRAMVRRLNGDLANDFGNLAQRVLSMIQRNCGGAVPRAGRLHAGRRDAAGGARSLLDRCGRDRTRRPSTTRWSASGRWSATANRYVDEQAPWALRKTDPGAHGNGALRRWPR